VKIKEYRITVVIKGNIHQEIRIVLEKAIERNFSKIFGTIQGKDN
jgi:hypothetical protein